jgi:protein-disulfide isomerase
MKRSSVFVGTVTIAAVVLLMVYGISAIAPLLQGTPDETAEQRPPAPTLPSVDFGNPSQGPTDAELTMVVFGDYQCESCAAFDATIKEVLAGYPNRVRLVWKDLPNAKSHPEARGAAIAARCAQEQGAFWNYHDLLMANQDALAASNLPLFAQELDLDGEAFAACISDKRTEPLVDRDVAEAISLGVTATPYSFIGERRASGALSTERLTSAIDAALTNPNSGTNQ